MKRLLLRTFASAAAALLLAGAGRQGGGGSRSGGSATMYRRHRVSVPQPSMPRPEHVVNDGGRAAYPQRDERGAAITQRPAVSPPAQHAAVARNEGFARGMGRLERTETTRNHYYWHNDGGIRYSHYYDGHYHWYGFYHGPNFYWTRYYGNRWWWYDGSVARWVFWWDGFWWWSGPGGAAYVYLDNSYYPYENEGVAVERAEAVTPPATHPEPGKGATTVSPDGKRSAQVFGADAQAFLYDKTATPPKFLKYLGSGVSQVRFSGGTGGAALQVLVEFKDGTFALFDQDGNSQSSALQSTESKSAPPPTPDSVPPPPSSAPGQ
jgi:hypothetical protein